MCPFVGVRGFSSFQEISNILYWTDPGPLNPEYLIATYATVNLLNGVRWEGPIQFLMDS